MESSQYYSAYGYGYGYWNEYGVTTEPAVKNNSTDENTSYRVFSQDQKNLHSMSFKEMRKGITTDDSYYAPGEDYYYTFCNDDSTTAAGGSEVGIALEFLEDLYFESHDLFKKVVEELKEKYTRKKFGNKQGHHEEEDDDGKVHLSKYLKKVPMRLQKKKLTELNAQTMRRSLSLGSPRTTPKSGEESTLKLQRFKVIKTLDLGGGGVQQGGQDHGGTN